MTNMRFYLRAVLVLSAALLIPVSARAGNCSCAAQTLNMGAYSVFAGGPTSATTSMTVTCNGNATYNVAFSTGNSGSYGSRTLIQTGGDSMTYNIYTDAVHSTVWAGTNVKVFNAPGGATALTLDLYLLIDPLQDLRYSGNLYQDNILVTMTPDPGTGGPTRSCSFTLQASVTAECQSPNATLAFGSYDPVVTNASVLNPLDVPTSLLYKCTKGVSATITLDNGSNASGGNRRLAGPVANFLLYDIYTNFARTIRWTTIAPGTVTAASGSKNTPLGGALGLPVYGRIPGNQDVRFGAYTDSVTATVNY